MKSIRTLTFWLYFSGISALASYGLTFTAIFYSQKPLPQMPIGGIFWAAVFGYCFQKRQFKNGRTGIIFGALGGLVLLVLGTALVRLG